MNKLLLSDEAQNDLVEIKAYITEELENPEAARSTITGITKQMKTLEQFSSAGAKLSSIVEVISDYRYLVCGNYIAFYRIEDTSVYIDRILYNRRDFVQILFEEEPEEE